MKIGIVCYPTFGGSGGVATELGIELSNKGHEVQFITYSQPVRLEALTSNQFRILSDWLQKVPSVKKEVEWCCSKCKADNKMELRGLQSFFT